jgi:ketosteroid isomerase-like protein
MTNTPDFIRSLYAAFGRGDLQAILDKMEPSIEWTSNGDAAVIPWGGKRLGVDGVASFFQALADNVDFEAFEPREFFDAGEAVTVIGRTRARVRKTGRVFDCEWAHVFVVKGGRLARFREFYDTDAMIRAVAA